MRQPATLNTPVVRKIVLTLLTGGVTYAVTNLTDQPQPTVLTLSVLIGGVTLLAQFLSSYDAQQRRAEERLSALEHGQSAGFREVRSTVTDATSQASRTADGGFADEVFWNSEAGLRYLEWQRQAIERGVTIRRIFVTDHEPTTATSGFRKIVREQLDVGIDVRILDASKLPPARRLLVPDVIIFDRTVSYELTQVRIPDLAPYFVTTRLILEPETVGERMHALEQLWAVAVKV
jgi:hypothetical protein